LDHVHSRDAGRDLGRVDVRVYPVGGLGRVLTGRNLGDRCEEEVATRVRLAVRLDPDELGILRGHGV